MVLFKRGLFLVILTSITFDLFGQNNDTSKITDPSKLFELIGKKTPLFKARLLSGEYFDLSLMKDTVIVLNFWFIQCQPCRPEIPYLNKLAAKFKNRKFKLISIAWNTENEFRKLYDPLSKKIILDSLRIGYNIIPDGHWISLKYSVYSYPRTFIIQNGLVKQVLFFTNDPKGSYERWKKEIRKLL